VSVAYDGSPEAERAAAVAARIARRSGAALRFVAVAETPEQRPAAQRAALRGLACAPVDIDALADVVDGPIVSTLANLPERTDLLVIGARGYRFMRRILLGGVIGALVRAAHYPVVVVPG
jgi:nucleotide-binding universal stress UspA family protein